ncbi:NADase-type glycan-binding domain-containing protein [Aquimarina litoralis]|uniref:NADase-type glycan-binding domain-containing protein n=1 Tax=Aquimarina litoralis TaxID=584605 RepID=UPI001C55E4E5|nr:hypothetical protein [Aquimarina litoralis]MBW1294270.1 hypothetical protein [Aquimarina litoralis]
MMICQSSFSQNIKISKDSLVTITENNGAGYDKYSLRPLVVKQCLVSSFLKTKMYNYKAENLIDANDQTAWVEGKNDNGIAEVIRITFDKNKGGLPYVIRIVPGYLKSEATWNQNNRVATINIRSIGINEYHKEYVIDEWKNVRLRKDSLTKVPMSAQYIDISQNYIQHMGYDDFIALELEIMEVDSIDAIYSDTCISELSFYTVDTLLKYYTYEEYEKLKQ